MLWMSMQTLLHWCVSASPLVSLALLIYCVLCNWICNCNSYLYLTRLFSLLLDLNSIRKTHKAFADRDRERRRGSRQCSNRKVAINTGMSFPTVHKADLINDMSAASQAFSPPAADGYDGKDCELPMQGNAIIVFNMCHGGKWKVS